MFTSFLYHTGQQDIPFLMPYRINATNLSMTKLSPSTPQNNSSSMILAETGRPYTMYTISRLTQLIRGLEVPIHTMTVR